MTDYSKGKIYRIVSDKTDQVYIGSTVQTLERRFTDHKSHFKCGPYCASTELLKLGDARIELIRDFPCNSERELAKGEDDEIVACCKVVNCRRASRTQAEWHKDNKAERNEQMKANYEANRQQVLERLKEPFECECGSTIRKGDKAKHFKTAKHQAFIPQ